MEIVTSFVSAVRKWKAWGQSSICLMGQLDWPNRPTLEWDLATDNSPDHQTLAKNQYPPTQHWLRKSISNIISPILTTHIHGSLLERDLRLSDQKLAKNKSNNSYRWQRILIFSWVVFKVVSASCLFIPPGPVPVRGYTPLFFKLSDRVIDSKKDLVNVSLVWIVICVIV